MTVILHVYCASHKLCIFGFYATCLGKSRHICVCVSMYLEIVSIVQREAIGLQSDSFALFSGDAVDALVVVIVVGGEVWREENTFRS